MRMRKKKNLIPRMERCGDRLIREPYAMPGKWRELMPQARELRVELGCGKGRFTAGTAAAEPDVLFIAVERVPDAMVMAMERCVAQGLTNVFFIDANADQLPLFFAPGEVDRIYINFCDPWPSNRHAKRRLTHGNFLRLYRQVLKMGGQIHFKTDNQDLFSFSIEELPLFGFELSEVTRDLHADGPVGVMTDYEAKFYGQGLPICRCVGTMVPWEEPFPTDIRRVKNRWLDVFAEGMDNMVGAHRRAAEMYFADGSIEGACPPLKALLHIMRDGEYEGKGLDSPDIRQMFSAESIKNSEWYAERLICRQQIEVNSLQNRLLMLKDITEKTPDELKEVEELKSALKRTKSIGYLKSLAGTLGADPFIVM